MTTATYYIGPQDGWTRVIDPGLTAYARISAAPETHPFYVYGDPSVTPTILNTGTLINSGEMFVMGSNHGDTDGFWVRVVNPCPNSTQSDGRTRFDVYYLSLPPGATATMLTGLSGISQVLNGTVVAPPAPAVKTDGYTGSTVTYTVGTDVAPGKLILKAWGGGGGGNFSTATATAQSDGGGAGFVGASFNLVNGDVITLKVGQGGQLPNVTTHVAGAGGYPDGGGGGSLTGNTSICCSGGGGSTQVFLNGTLIAVAGAGGGGAGTGGGNFGTRTGPSGGTTSSDSSSGTHGASQSAGGVNDNDATQNGASLAGGKGGLPSTAQSTGLKGGGGGGGFFGGCGGGNAAVNGLGSGLGGTGGVSYFNSGHAAYVAASGSTTAGSASTTAAGNDSDPAYANNAGRGGARASNVSLSGVLGTVGDNGRSVLSFGN